MSERANELAENAATELIMARVAHLSNGGGVVWHKWELVQKLKELHDAGYRAAIEAAAQAQCSLCEEGNPVELIAGKRWIHRADGLIVTCGANLFRALKEAE